jgi:hypothetical protein
VAVQRVVVEVDLGVERETAAVLGDDQRVDLEQSCQPRPGSTDSLRIFSGWVAATSSMSMPPSRDAITVTRPEARSSSMPR